MQTYIRFNSSQKNYVLNKTRRYKYYGSFTPEIYYTIAIANATAILFYGGGEIGITIVKMGVQPVLEPNGNYNRNIVINLRCEWTRRAHSHWSTTIAIWRTSEKKIYQSTEMQSQTLSLN